MRLKGKRAFVTAAGAGIGRATAEAFAAEGAEVIATDIDEARSRRSPGMTTRRLDVLDGAAIAARPKEAGAVDILFNCAGFVHHGTIMDCDDRAFDFSMALNVKANYAVTRAFLPAMLANGGGSIIFVASVASSIIAAPNRFVYGATKAAVIGMIEGIAADFVTKGIRSNAICPGTVDSPSLNARIRRRARPRSRSPPPARPSSPASPRAASRSPGEIATLAVYLASDEASFVTGRPSPSTAAGRTPEGERDEATALRALGRRETRPSGRRRHDPGPVVPRGRHRGRRPVGRGARPPPRGRPRLAAEGRGHAPPRPLRGPRGQVHLHRAQLFRPRRRDRRADPGRADHLHEGHLRHHRPPRRRHHPQGLREDRLGGRAWRRDRDRGALRLRSRGAGPCGGLLRGQRPLRTRLPDRTRRAVDQGQVGRHLRPHRAMARDARRGRRPAGPPHVARDRREALAGRVHEDDDLRGGASGVLRQPLHEPCSRAT
jgi:2-keto-3-deoxy-L-fuconate dehydrogenase